MGEGESKRSEEKGSTRVRGVTEGSFVDGEEDWLQRQPGEVCEKMKRGECVRGNSHIPHVLQPPCALSSKDGERERERANAKESQ